MSAQELEEKLRERWSEVRTEFDFEKAHRVMVFLEWKWVPDGVPTVDRMREAADSLFESTLRGSLACEGRRIGASSGGLFVVVSKMEVSLRFVVCKKQTYIEDECWV